ncbi:MAG: hypothetical protein ACRC7O_04550 [Fimbriiglobus sp.]
MPVHDPYALIDFDDLKPAEVPVKIGGVDYVLREATGGAAVAFRNAMSRNTRVSASGQLLGTELSEAEPLVVGMCLMKTGKDGAILLGPTGVPQAVGTEFVKARPVRVQTVLFERLKEISPTLVPGDDTVESLEKSVAVQTAKLEKLREDGAAGDDGPKDGSAGTTGISG